MGGPLLDRLLLVFHMHLYYKTTVQVLKMSITYLEKNVFSEELKLKVDGRQR